MGRIELPKNVAVARLTYTRPGKPSTTVMIRAPNKSTGPSMLFEPAVPIVSISITMVQPSNSKAERYAITLKLHICVKETGKAYAYF